jgi:hypothetical protein
MESSVILEGQDKEEDEAIEYCKKNKHLWQCNSKGNITECLVCQMSWTDYKMGRTDER